MCPGRRPMTATIRATRGRRSGRASSAAATFVSGPSATTVSGPSSSAASSPWCPVWTGSVRPRSADKLAASSRVVRSTASSGAFPATVEIPTISKSRARARSASARQSSGSARALWPQAASVSIQSLCGKSGRSAGGSNTNGASPRSPVRQVSTGIGSVISRPAARTSTAIASLKIKANLRRNTQRAAQPGERRLQVDDHEVAARMSRWA